MSVAIICDGCGRRIETEAVGVLKLVVSESTSRDALAVVKHYCPDPNGGTVGCARKMSAVIANSERGLKAGTA